MTASTKKLLASFCHGQGGPVGGGILMCDATSKWDMSGDTSVCTCLPSPREQVAVLHLALLCVLNEGFIEMFEAVPFAEPPVLGPSSIETLPDAGNLEILLSSCPWY